MQGRLIKPPCELQAFRARAENKSQLAAASTSFCGGATHQSRLERPCTDPHSPCMQGCGGCALFKNRRGTCAGCEVLRLLLVTSTIAEAPPPPPTGDYLQPTEDEPGDPDLEAVLNADSSGAPFCALGPCCLLYHHPAMPLLLTRRHAVTWVRRRDIATGSMYYVRQVRNPSPRSSSHPAGVFSE